MKQGPPEPIVLDRAKWHDESVSDLGLDPEQSFVHTGLFVAWCALRGLWREMEGSDLVIAEMRDRTVKPTALYEWCDGTFISNMVTVKGDVFARQYFVFEKDRYLFDYEKLLCRKLPSIFHVPNTWESYDLLAPVLDHWLAKFEEYHRERRGRS